MIDHDNIISSGTKAFAIKILMCFVVFLFHQTLKAQPEKPPRPLIVTTYQHLEFGTIIAGNNGGTVIISPNGTRSSTGDIILPSVGSSGKEAIYNIKAAPGTLITILLGSSSLSWSGYFLNLVLNSTFPGSPFVTSHQQGESTFVHVGGTLYVGNPLSNPAGPYSGQFTVTFIQE